MQRLLEWKMKARLSYKRYITDSRKYCHRLRWAALHAISKVHHKGVKGTKIESYNEEECEANDHGFRCCGPWAGTRNGGR